MHYPAGPKRTDRCGVRPGPTPARPSARSALTADAHATLAEQALELGVEAAHRFDPILVSHLETMPALGRRQLQHDGHLARKRAQDRLELVEQVHLDTIGVDYQGDRPRGADAVEGPQLEGDQLDVVFAFAAEPAAHQDDGIFAKELGELLADAAEGYRLDTAVDVVQAKHRHRAAAARLAALQAGDDPSRPDGLAVAQVGELAHRGVDQVA